jgi:hypothetical protein
LNLFFFPKPARANLQKRAPALRLEFSPGSCHPSFMRFFPVKPDRTVLRFCVLSSAILLGACASHSPQQAETATALTPATKGEKTAVTPRPVLSRIFTPVAHSPSPEDISAAVPPAKEPTRAEKIARLVRRGSLIQADGNILVFSRDNARPAAPSGMYEDAIILGQLRRQLKQVRNLPDSIYASATVNNARAFLVIDGDIPCAPAADAINAALKADGVTTVQARLLNPTRL